MSDHVIVWDLDTVPDIAGYAAANGLIGRSNEEIRESLGNKFPKHIYHSIVCIGALVAHKEHDYWAVDAIGAPFASPNAEYMSGFRSFIQKMEVVMAQASVLTDAEIRRVFRIIDTTRHIERNRLAFVLSIFAGLRVGEIAALTVGDVATADGDVRREIKNEGIEGQDRYTI
jgi:hypothetical protein